MVINLNGCISYIFLIFGWVLFLNFLIFYGLLSFFEKHNSLFIQWILPFLFISTLLLSNLNQIISLLTSLWRKKGNGFAVYKLPNQSKSQILFDKNSSPRDLYTITLVATVKKKWSFPKSETHHAFSGGWLCCNSTHYDVLEFEKQKGSSMPVRRPSTFHTVGFSQFFGFLTFKLFLW